MDERGEDGGVSRSARYFGVIFILASEKKGIASIITAARSISLARRLVAVGRPPSRLALSRQRGCGAVRLSDSGNVASGEMCLRGETVSCGWRRACVAHVVSSSGSTCPPPQIVLFQYRTRESSFHLPSSFFDGNARNFI
jgi:hypothetical protein